MINIENYAVNTIRMLAADAVQKAKSGHPGLPMGAAPMAYTVFAKQLRHNPKNPAWENRDRFILSAGHGSSLLYSLLYLFGYGLSIEDLKNFRQLNSKTPGHPEHGHTLGVEVTTGPLGQGVANAVGMALAETRLAAEFNRPEFPIVDHYTYVLCGDGCLMEGVSAEACSLAGTLGLGKLILLYDSNNITIEGDTNIAFREDVIKRYEAYGWHCIEVKDGNNIDDINDAINKAKSVTDKPSLIKIKTQIGFGSPNKAGKASVHGEPLGDEELKLTKQNLGLDPNAFFQVPNDVATHFDELISNLEETESAWNGLIEKYKQNYPDLFMEWEKWNADELSVDLLNNEDFWTYEGNLATRISSEKVLNKVCKLVPNLIGGSADLAPSNKTIMQGMGDYSKEDYSGSNLHFGVREHAMAAIANGIALHGGLRIYIAGFFVFSDYMKPSLRLSALMNIPVISIFTHDSIGVGEDGPTHQPIEQLAMLRSLPNYTVIRPCDTKETAAAWYLALTRKAPTAIALTRQNLTLLPETGKKAIQGGYILRDSEKETPDLILIATGSEVELIYKAKDVLKEKGIDARVVSMPSWEVFNEQPIEYKQSVLPLQVKKRIAVEAASGFGWHEYVGHEGCVISIDSFGASAPAELLFEKYGFSVDNIVQKAVDLMSV